MRESYLVCWFSYHLKTDFRHAFFFSFVHSFYLFFWFGYTLRPSSWLVCRVDFAEMFLIYVIRSLNWARACSMLFALIIITRILPFSYFNALNIAKHYFFYYWIESISYVPCVCVCCWNWRTKQETHFSLVDASSTLPFPTINKTEYEFCCCCCCLAYKCFKSRDKRRKKKLTN